MADRVERIADRVAADWFARAPHANLAGDDAPHDLDDAYRIQAAVQARLTVQRGAIAGRKIALSSEAMQQMVGIDRPIAGAFFSGDIHASPAEIRAVDFRHLGIEFELAIEIARDIVPGEVHTADSVRGLIAAVHPAFELIEDRGADYTDLDVLSLIADNAWCGGVVLGPPIPGGPTLDLATLPGLIAETGVPDEPTVTGAADPLGSLAWVAAHADAHGAPLRAGEIVITGSAARTRFPAAGTALHYTVAGATVSLALA